MSRRFSTICFLSVVFPLYLLFTSAAWAVNSVSAQTMPAPENEPAANTRAAAPLLAPSRSVLDSEPIVSHGNGNAGAPPTVARPGQLPELELPRVAGALAVVIGLIFLLRWGGKKLFQQPGDRRSTRAVQILAKSPISPRQNILLLRVGKRVIIVGDSGTQMNPLSEITDPDEVASLLSQLRDDQSDLSTKAFGALFGRAKREMSGHDDALRENSDISEEASEQSGNDLALDPAISDSHNEINGLVDRLRTLSTHFKSGSA